MNAVAVDLRQHGEKCRCVGCSTVRLYLEVDQWEAAVHEAFEAGIIDDVDIELAYRSSINVLFLAGFRGFTR